jgi:XTP/dITP diphosphohydrolase
MIDLLIATTNSGKLIEISAHLKGLPFRLISLKDLSEAPSVVEDGRTFLENARKKAHELARWSGKPTLADDSGLVVEALGGRPGIHSARYAGENATDEDNRRLLLKELEGVPEKERGAAFVCVLVLAGQEGDEIVTEGRVEGRITTAPRGDGGFGYDPLFFVPSLGRTTAELSLEEKNKISHRGLALDAMREKMNGHSFNVHIALKSKTNA